MKYYKYPDTVTENFDNANFHINYCLSFIKKYLHGDILEVGAGCGSFTRNYFTNKISNILLTEIDKKNIITLNKKFKKNRKILIQRKTIYKINKKFDVILYLHVLEHIKKDKPELQEAKKKLKKNGYLIILSPAHQKIYSNLDRMVGHFRRYESSFFKRKINSLKLINFKFLDSMGYILYYFNKLIFKKETYPSKIKIFIWDKFFTPISFIFDFILGYKFGKAILAVYKKN